MAEPPDKKEKTVFKITAAPFAAAERLVRQGLETRINPEDIAAEIRKHGVEVMPENVTDYLCRYLEGKIEKRGRSGDTPFERKTLGRHYHMIYTLVRLAQAGNAQDYPEMAEFYEQHKASIEESYSPSEAAWRLVSLFCFGNDGHHKNIKNAAGARNKTIPSKQSKPAR